MGRLCSDESDSGVKRMTIVYLSCFVVVFAVGIWLTRRIDRIEDRIEHPATNAREALEQELMDFPPCLTCDHLKSLRPKNETYYTYACELKDKGFDIAPLYCKYYKEREGSSGNMSSVRLKELTVKSEEISNLLDL